MDGDGWYDDMSSRVICDMRDGSCGCLGHEIHRQVVLVMPDKVNGAFSDLLDDLSRQQLLDRLHKGRFAVASL